MHHMLPAPSKRVCILYRRHSGEEAAEEDDSKKSKRHRSDKDRSSDKRDDDDRFAPRLSCCPCVREDVSLGCTLSQ